MELALPESVRWALSELEKNGYESYAVGGCVRDSLLGRVPQDWDLCTAARPEETMACFPGARTIPTGLRHGTVTLLTDEGPLEITTFRRDGDYSDGRHPDRVDFVSAVREDLRRRDFTINAMAWSPLRGLRDEFGGQEDLRRGLIRCVGDPDERFREDALRILRALRFAARYGYAIEENTARALRRGREGLKNVSRERIFSELKGILRGDGAGEMLTAFPEVFFTVLPELAPMLGLDQKMPDRHDRDVWGHTARAVDAIPAEDILRLTMLFHDISKPAVFSIDPVTGRGRFYGHAAAGAVLADRALRSLRCDNDTREAVVTLVGCHSMPGGHGKSDLRRLLSRLGEENFRRLLLVRRADALAHAPAAQAELLARAEADERTFREILAEGGPLRVSELSVGGGELRSLGFAGPAIGRALRELLEEVLSGTLPNEKAALLRRAAEMQSKNPSIGGNTMNESVKVTWLGHSCFQLTWGDFSLVTDPYADGKVPGFPPLRVTASAVYCSHSHPDHNAAELVTIDGKAAPEGFSVEEIPCPHDHHGGKFRGMNTIRVFHFGDLRIVHMGDVGCPLPEESLRALRGCDLLLIPVGGHFTINGAEAYALWQEIAPKAVVPMHYRCQKPAFGFSVIGGAEGFLDNFPAGTLQELETNSFTLTHEGPAGVLKLTPAV